MLNDYFVSNVAEVEEWSSSNTRGWVRWQSSLWRAISYDRSLILFPGDQVMVLERINTSVLIVVAIKDKQ